MKRLIRRSAFLCAVPIAWALDLFVYFAHLEGQSGLVEYESFNFSRDLVPRLRAWSQR